MPKFKVSRQKKGPFLQTKSDKFLSRDWVLSGTFVKLPPDGTVNADVAKGPPSDTTTRVYLKAKELGFIETKNPVYAIEAFLIANGSGLYPPLWALEWLNDGFQRYHDGQGTLQIDKALGLAKSRGQNSPFKTLLEQDRDDQWMHDIFRLTTLFHVSVEEAAKMVVGRLESFPGWNKTAYKSFKIPSYATLQDKFARHFKRSWDTPRNRKILRDGWPSSRAKEFLASFPRESWPKNRVIRLRGATAPEGKKCLKCDKILSPSDNRLCRKCFRINSAEPD